jgi:hypothetical protein
MKWLIIIGVFLYLYFTLTIDVETTNPTVNTLLSLPYSIKLSDILSAGTSKLPIDFKIHF